MSNPIKTVRDRLANKSARVKMFMQSEIGKEVIKILEDEFYHCDLFDSSPEQTAFNLGRRDAVVFLQELQNWKPRK